MLRQETNRNIKLEQQMEIINKNYNRAISYLLNKKNIYFSAFFLNTTKAQVI